MLMDASIANLGAAASILVGISFLLVLLAAGLMPGELQGNSEAHEFWMAMSESSTAHLLFHWFYALGGLAAFAALPAIFFLVRSTNLGLVIFTTGLAYFAFAVNARSHLLEVAWDRYILRNYRQADEAFQRAVHVVAGYALDVPDGFVTHGGLGLWLLVTNLLGYQFQLFPTLLALLGIGAGLLNWVIVCGYVLQNSHNARLGARVLSIGIVLGNSFGAIWFIWIGIILLGMAS